MNLQPPLPNNELDRLNALRQYQILDTPSEKVFDDLTFLAAQICHTPIALISLIDGNRQWFKSKVGLTVPETSRDLAFCAYTILQQKPLIVRNALADSRFATNALVLGDPNIRFYAAAPLITPEGFGIGSLCVIDIMPRDLTLEQVEALRILSSQVMAQFELRRHAITLSRTIIQQQQTAEQLRQQHDFIEVFYRRGEEKARKGDYEGAIVDFNEFLRLNPNGFKAYYNRGLARQKLGDYEGAIIDFDKYLRFNPNDVEARQNRGLLRFELGDYKGAIADYSSAMNPHSDNSIPGDMGFTYSEVENKEAVVEHTHYLELHSSDIDIDTDINITQTHTRSVLENNTNTFDDSIQFLPFHSDDGEVYVTLSNTQYQPEESTQALLLSSDQAKLYIQRGHARCELNDYSAAIEDYTQSLKMNPHDPQAYISRGNARFILKDYTGAIDDYTQCLWINPNHAKTYISRGNVYCELEDYSAAIKDYTRCLELNSNNAEAYINRANARSRLKDYHGAIEDYTHFLQLNPNDAKAYISRGNARSKLKDYSGAIEDYKRVWSKAIEQLPKLSSEEI
ncbi:tetratricopeptide repeat protein [Brasilonema bromeliae]|uniref:Guanylate cyclase n=1 Tax=Brasilonema bromeliae SPC951 TaxID=385972 RepID=A0ABX1P8R8_9CYAN|nr:tetratricopeptide repeat protein [Brasilonema bromeliae]NMG20321.1 guanylate cyclase [Brasilonema bromeliae SPC951]